MLNKKEVESILLEVEASNYNHEKHLQDFINEVLNNNNNDVKYIITSENDYNYLTLYKYSESDYIQWLYINYDIYEDELSELKNNYSMICEYVKQNYIEYYMEENILNFINVSKFRNMLYNKKSVLNITLNNIYVNIQNYANNEYLIYEYNLNKKLYHELKKIQKEVVKNA